MFKLCKLVSILLPLLLAVLAGGVNAASENDRRHQMVPDYERLVTLADQRQKVRVIVTYSANEEESSTVKRNSSLNRLQRFKKNRDRLARRLSSKNISPLREFRNYSGAVYSVTRAELDDLIAGDEIERVFEDKLNKPSLKQSVVLIGADLNHSYGMKGNGTNVVVLDTGIEGTHSAFAGRMVTEACFSTNYSSYNSTNLCPDGSSFVNGQKTQFGSGAAALDKCTDVDCSHGTHVASIVGGSDATITGVAPEVGIIAIQVFSHFSSDTECGTGKAPCILAYDSDLISALEHVADLTDGTEGNYSIASVNMSFSAGQYSSACDADTSYTSQLDALDTLGVALVAASGNSSKTDKVSSPACVSNVISVGSVHDTTDEVSSWSNAHPDLLDILAPGQGGIKAALPGGTYGGKSGTSMAAPHVAGAIALLKAYNSSYTVGTMKSLLLDHSVAVDDTRSGTLQTYPRLDLFLVTHFLAGAAEVPQLTINSPGNNSVINIDQPVVLQASAIDPQDGNISGAVQWTSDLDGALSSPVSLSLGSHTLVATVTDSTGFSANDTVTVEVFNGPAVAITLPIDNTEFLESESVSFNGSASDIEDGSLSSSMQWISNRDGNVGTGSSFDTSLSAGIHTITATVTDSDGATPTTAPSVQVTILTDADADSLPDDWEAEYGVDDPSGDPDGDTLTTLDEFLAGSHPNDAAPFVAITSPVNGLSHDSSMPVNLIVFAIDNEDGNISDEVQWYSNLDGFLGTGETINEFLSIGTHTISTVVTDSRGAEPVIPATVSVDVVDGIAGDVNGDGLVDVADLILLQLHINGTLSLDAAALLRSDLHTSAGDGSIDLADMLFLQQLLLND